MPELCEIRLNHARVFTTRKMRFQFWQIDCLKFSIQAFSCSLNSRLQDQETVGTAPRSCHGCYVSFLFFWVLCLWNSLYFLPQGRLKISQRIPLLCSVFYPDYVNISQSANAVSESWSKRSKITWVWRRNHHSLSKSYERMQPNKSLLLHGLGESLIPFSFMTFSFQVFAFGCSSVHHLLVNVFEKPTSAERWFK